MYNKQQIYWALKEQNFTHKQVVLHAKEQNERKRNQFVSQIYENPGYTASMMCFFDETHSCTSDARRKYARATRGEPAFKPAFKNNGRSHASSALCLLSIRGMVDVHVYDTSKGGIKATDVNFSLERFIIATNCNPYPGANSVFFLDNARTHNAETITALCMSHGVLLFFLPPYSYDLNPIELAFHSAKARLKRIHPTVDPDAMLREHLHECLMNSVTPQQACNLFEHCRIPIRIIDRAYADGGLFPSEIDMMDFE